MQIEQVFERPSGCRLFQLFGDVMPETLFAVRSDSETYGMQRSVERQVNTSYPVFPHIRYIFIAARLPLTGRECRSLRSVSRLLVTVPVPGRETCCSHPAMTLCIPSGISRSECCIPCEEYPLRFHGPAAARHRTRVVRRLPVSHTRPVAIPEFRRHLGEELPMSETMQPVVGYRCGVPVFRDIQQRCEIVIA